MKSQTALHAVPTDLFTPAQLTPPPELPPLYPPSRIRQTCSHRGARLARLLAVERLGDWGIACGTSTAAVIAAVIGELVANAVTHGRTPGRDFELRLSLTAAAVRIEVIDTRPDRFPRVPRVMPPPSADATGGRGLLLVAAFADRWGWTVRDPYTKTVWAEVDRPRDGGPVAPEVTSTSAASD
ncbi:ATP-binding protein [Streptomyces sp. NPDC051569]|uniref:ATP-binding protein n=1 Tax=Streptomyces sp. NPDC051569 TaxID=3365661 RepID=UPI0037BA5781